MSSEMSPHGEGCWRFHHDCAVLRVQQLEEENRALKEMIDLVCDPQVSSDQREQLKQNARVAVQSTRRTQ